MSEKYHFEDWTDSQLKDIYEFICDEYRRRLCEQWSVPFGESWWILDRIGTELCIADAPWGIGMDEIRYLVDNHITEPRFMEWWSFVENEIHDGLCPPRINFKNWFENNCRPKDLNNGENNAVV